MQRGTELGFQVTRRRGVANAYLLGKEGFSSSTKTASKGNSDAVRAALPRSELVYKSTRNWHEALKNAPYDAAPRSFAPAI